jgi:hypothetical protein
MAAVGKFGCYPGFNAVVEFLFVKVGVGVIK